MDTFDASRPTEQQIERYLKRVVEKTGGYCLKFVSPGFAGVPDRIILLPGAQVLFAELKAPGKKPRPNQKAVHRILEKLGFTVFGCVDSYTAADAVARTCEEIARKGEGDRR